MCLSYLLLPGLGSEASRPDQKQRELVAKVYREVLGREPDAEGWGHYAGQLRDGRDEAWLRKELLNSREGQLRHKPDVMAAKERRDAIFRAGGVLVAIGGCWLGSFMVLMGWGLSFLRLLRFGRDPEVDAFQLCWIGLGALSVYLFWWHLFAAVDVWCMALSFIPAFFGLKALLEKRIARSTASLPQSLPGRQIVLAGMIFLLSITAIASVARGLNAYDTLLYHLQSVRWNNEYAAVPGLANLHIRLGTNSAWHLLAALVNHGPMAERSAWIMPGMINVFFAGYLIHLIIVVREIRLTTRMFALIVLPFPLREAVYSSPGLYFDLPAQYLLIASIIEWLRCADRVPANRQDRLFCMLPALACGALSFVIKPIGFPTLLCMTSIFFFYMAREVKSGEGIKRAVQTFALPGLLILGWVARNAILSGWLLFPLPVLALPVDWRVPLATSSDLHQDQIQTVEGQKQIIKAWARNPGPAYTEAIGASFQAWFPGWYERNKAAFELRWLWPSGVILFFVLFLVGRSSVHRRDLILSILAISQIAFWLLQAPDLRFGAGLLWIWLAVPASVLLGRPGSRWPVKFSWLSGLAAVCILSYGFLTNLPGHLSKSKWTLGKSGTLPLQRIELNGSGSLTVFVPVHDDRVGDAPLPSTPYPSVFLEARVPGDLSKGFRRDLPAF